MRMIFVNLPVEDVTRSKAFFAALGFEFNAEFSDDSCTCMIVEENIYVMLLARARFTDFINDEVSDTSKSTEVITCLSADSRKQVDDTITEAIAAGGKSWKPVMEEGPMYGGSFQDPDGHVWELVHIPQQ